MRPLNLILVVLVFVREVAAQSTSASIDPSTPFAYFNSMLSVICYSDSNSTPDTNATVGIATTSQSMNMSFVGNTSGTMNGNSQAKFSLYFTSPGSITLNISCPSSYTNLTIAINPEVISLETVTYVNFT